MRAVVSLAIASAALLASPFVLSQGNAPATPPSVPAAAAGNAGGAATGAEVGAAGGTAFAGPVGLGAAAAAVAAAAARAASANSHATPNHSAQKACGNPSGRGIPPFC